MRKGFTLVEIIIVSLVISLFCGLAIANYRFFNETKILEAETKKFAETLELAKKRTLSAEKKVPCIGGGTHTYDANGVWYKVSWTASEYSLIPNGCGAEFTYKLPDSFTISPVPSTIVFYLHTVNLFTRIDKDVTFTITNTKISKSKTITVKTDGTITY